MIVKESQLQKEWPVELTPELREQFLKEKVARVSAWYKRSEKNEQTVPDFECS